MLFNSLEYLLFFSVFFIIYWQINKINSRAQILSLVLASYVFYGWWDWRFLILIVLSTLIDFCLGLKIEQSSSQILRKRLLILSCVSNLGILGFFKYFNFFRENLALALSSFGVELDLFTLNVILPVGISFYTFQTLSYTIDVYRKDVKAVRDLPVFMCYVAFFPQLVAGPIERAKNLLPQFTQERKFDFPLAVDGCRQILWGFFKKVVIADNCASLLNPVFGNYMAYDSLSLIGAAVLFSFQIYGDFSGYSDIAIGTSKLFGVRLKQNFSFPYFSRDIAEFWRRWHISLSSWFKDYLYFTLGGSRGSTGKSIRNIFIIFLISGFWHGANWTFIVWGLVNAIYFLPSFVLKQNRNNLEAIGKLTPWIVFQMLVTFSLTTLAWIIFRSESLIEAWYYLCNIASSSGTASITSINQIPQGNLPLTILSCYILFMLFIEWKNRTMAHGLARLPRSTFMTIGLFLFLSHEIIQYFFSDEPFIYFQF